MEGAGADNPQVGPGCRLPYHTLPETNRTTT